jgi:alpha-glutamyl/putrescinyl thymine pyrophosphorylase clade 1
MSFSSSNESRREQFFWWMNERHRIYLRKKAGKPYPWTTDPVMQMYKFTNVYRDLDRVSVDVRKQILNHYSNPWRKEDAALLVRDVIAYRIFNLPATWRRIEPLLDDWDEHRAIRRLTKAKNAGATIFTGAYIVPNGGKRVPKIELSCQRVTAGIEHAADIVTAIRADRTMQNATRVIGKFIPLCAGFNSYEIASDLRWTPLLNKASDLMTWANPGPGAARGLKLIWPDIKPYEEIDGMRTLLRESQRPGVLGKHMRPLEMRDIEHSLCEFAKWCRGTTRSRYHPSASLPKRRAA